MRKGEGREEQENTDYSEDQVTKPKGVADGATNEHAALLAVAHAPVVKPEDKLGEK